MVGDDPNARHLPVFTDQLRVFNGSRHEMRKAGFNMRDNSIFADTGKG